MSRRLKEPIQVHSFDEYEELLRKVSRHPDRFPAWEPWFEWNLTIDDVDNPDIRGIFKDNVCILETFRRLYNHRVRVQHVVFGQTEVYILTGVQVTNEDFYWILKDEHKTKYMTCLASIVDTEQ